MEIKHKVRLKLRSSFKEISFKKSMPTENYQLGVSLICIGKTSVAVGVKEILKYPYGFKVVFTRAVPTDKWQMFYHAKHL